MPVDLEKTLRPIDSAMAPYPPKYMTLASGDTMVIRQASRDDVPTLLEYVEPLTHVERDYYDIVAARVYAELLSYSMHRVQDEYVLVAQIDGELAAIVNGRQVTPKLGMSLHTLALRRGLRVGRDHLVGLEPPGLFFRQLRLGQHGDQQDCRGAQWDERTCRGPVKGRMPTRSEQRTE